MKKTYLLWIGFLGFAIAMEDVVAQTPIVTAATFLNQNIDARSSGLGSLGVATSPDVYAQQWNAAKYIFSEKNTGASLSYSPFNTGSSNGLYYAMGTFFAKPKERSAWGTSFRYFNLGEIYLNEYIGGEIIDRGITKPNEFAVDVSYSLKLYDNFSMGVTSRFIRSDLNQTSLYDKMTFNSLCFDIGAYYQGESQNSVRFRHGAVISNLGPKVKYSTLDDPYFIPITLKLGSSIEFQMEKENALIASLEFNKLLVPTLFEDQINSNLIQGIFSSFSDAPNGFSEELNEITWAVGMEYRFQNKFSLRSGYFKESPNKGFRQYFTFGAGFESQLLSVDLSYLVNNSEIQNQLQNKIRISIVLPIFTKNKGEETPENEVPIESEAPDSTATSK